MIGFVIQVTLTIRIHRCSHLLRAAGGGGQHGRGGPPSCCSPRALGAEPAHLDTSDTVDKTSRRSLLPLPLELKYRAKPFVDVTMDRLAKGVGALLILICIKDWGFGLDWQQLSYVSAVLVGLWIVVAIAARREYMRSFRKSIEQQTVAPAELRFNNPDPQSVETLVSELAHPEPRRVLYAIDLLDAMDKRHLITPLLLAHESAEVRARALASPKRRDDTRRSLAARRRARAEDHDAPSSDRAVSALPRCAARRPWT